MLALTDPQTSTATYSNAQAVESSMEVDQPCPSFSADEGFVTVPRKRKRAANACSEGKPLEMRASKV